MPKDDGTRDPDLLGPVPFRRVFRRIKVGASVPKLVNHLAWMAHDVLPVLRTHRITPRLVLPELSMPISTRAVPSPAFSTVTFRPTFGPLDESRLERRRIAMPFVEPK